MRRLMIVALVGGALAGCGRGEPASPDDPDGAATDDPRAALAAEAPGAVAADLPPALAELQAQAGELLDGGPDAFEARLGQLEGHPIVVNKWASWCAPCRAEFPFFAAQAEQLAGEVAFLGVDSGDVEADARSFLDELPVPYPSYLDPDLEVAAVFNGVTAFPTTAFYDAAGELVYVKQGGYASEELLAQDIERYLRVK